MFIQSFCCGPFDTNAYVIGCQKTKMAAIIDPAPGSYPSIVECISSHNFTVQTIILTHSHWDHIGDLAAIKSHFHAPLAMHEADAENVRHPGSDGLPCWVSIDSAEPDTFFKDTDTFSIGDTNWKVLHTPGHSPGSICFYCEENTTLISGDTLFKGTYGNLFLPTSEPQRMPDSLRLLAKLPSGTIVFPGHGEKTTIAAELPWLQKI